MGNEIKISKQWMDTLPCQLLVQVTLPPCQLLVQVTLLFVQLLMQMTLLPCKRVSFSGSRCFLSVGRAVDAAALSVVDADDAATMQAGFLFRFTLLLASC